MGFFLVVVDFTELWFPSFDCCDVKEFHQHDGFIIWCCCMFVGALTSGAGVAAADVDLGQGHGLGDGLGSPLDNGIAGDWSLAAGAGLWESKGQRCHGGDGEERGERQLHGG